MNLDLRRAFGLRVDPCPTVSKEFREFMVTVAHLRHHVIGIRFEVSTVIAVVIVPSGVTFFSLGATDRDAHVYWEIGWVELLMGEVRERVLALLVDDSRSTASARIDNWVWPNSHGDDGSRTKIHVGQIVIA